MPTYPKKTRCMADGGKVKKSNNPSYPPEDDVNFEQAPLTAKAKAEGRYGVSGDKVYMNDAKLSEYNKTRDMAESKNFPKK